MQLPYANVGKINTIQVTHNAISEEQVKRGQTSRDEDVSGGSSSPKHIP